MRIEKSCPLPKTHTRLRQAHDLWHEVEIAYADADAFVRELNNFLSAARSVTFVLQAEGRRRDKTLFNAWYEQEQDAMRSDPRLKWLVAARNEVEKEGDLDTHSVAQVSVATTNVDLDFGAIEVPPLASPSEIAAAVEIDDLPDRIRKQAVLVVERRWTVPELPDDELLDVLGHCYGRIADVVREAHALFGVTMQTFGGETHEGRHRREPHPSGRLPCMLPTTEMRTAYWHLEEDTLVEVVRESQPAPSSDEMAEIEEEGRRRYGDLAGHQWMPGTDLVTQPRRGRSATSRPPRAPRSGVGTVRADRRRRGRGVAPEEPRHLPPDHRSVGALECQQARVTQSGSPLRRGSKRSGGPFEGPICTKDEPTGSK